MRARLFLIWSTFTAGCLLGGLAVPPSPGRLFAMVLGLWICPGWALARWVHNRIGLNLLERAVATAVAPVLIHAYAATVLALVHVDPRWICLVGIPVAVFTLLRPAKPGASRPTEHSTEFRRGFVVLGIAGAIALAVSYFQPMSGVTSDANAHIAATNAALHEGKIFPEHEFYSDEANAGPDPRFGVLHAWYAGLAWWAGVEAVDVWRWLQPLGSWLWMVALAALSAALCRDLWGFGMAWLLFLGSYIGTISNPLAFGMAPFYVGFATVLTAMGIAWRTLPRRAGAVAASVAIVGAGQMHAMPFLLGCLLLGAAAVADRPHRGQWSWALGTLVALGLPWMSLRFALSYASANPINAWSFQIVTWGESLKGASPDYLLARVSWPGLMLLPLAPWLGRLKERPEGRWVLLLCFGVLIWVIFPPTFALTWALVSLLTLRLTMGILFPLAWGLWLDMPSSPGRGRSLARGTVITLLVLLGGMGLVDRVRPSGQVDSANDFQRHPDWEELIDVAHASLPRGGVILSDPFTMLALKARLPQHVVAVPGGRSSPRDSKSLERLHDAWVAMSVHGNGEETQRVLEEYGVTHVVLNQTFVEPLHDIECEIDPRTFPAQLQKFESNPGSFRPLWARANLRLYEVRVGQALENTGYFEPCVEPRAAVPPEPTLGEPLTGGLTLVSAEMQASEVHAGDQLSLRLQIAYDGEDRAPHRRLAIRLDAVDSPVPGFLAPVGKPIRKLFEKTAGRKWRARWTVGAGQPGCLSSQLRSAEVMSGTHGLTVPANLTPGRYDVTVQAVRVAPFNVPDIRDFFRDEDYYRGSVAATVEVLPPSRARER